MYQTLLLSLEEVLRFCAEVQVRVQSYKKYLLLCKQFITEQSKHLL